MSEAYDEALVELRQLANEFHEHAEQVTYGFFCGGDPRTFSPDPECSTDEERANHKRLCADWESGKNTAAPMPQCARGTELGFGLGTQVFGDPVYSDAADRLARILDRLERDE